jgi:alpha-L-fucosidase
MKLGFYYSIMDWHHPDYIPVRKWEKGKRSTEGADFNRYIKYMKEQIRELMTGYGPIVALWFDGGWEHDESDEELKAFKDIIDMARELQPNILINDRAGIGGDYKTPEQRIPATGIVDKDGNPAMWEVCMTMTTGHGSFQPTAWWGYDAHEKIFKTKEELIHKLVDVVSKGGNFLLNVGPEPSGKIRPEEAERLEVVGRWMDKYSESIYGTTASPFRLLPFFGRVTQKSNKLYVHVFDWPKDGKLSLPGLKTLPVKAGLVGHPSEKVTAELGNHDGLEGLVLRLPKEATDPIDSVIVLDFDSKPVVKPLVIKPAKDGNLNLPAAFAEIHAEHGQRAKPLSENGRPYIGNWSNPKDIITWNFTMPKAGSYRAKLDARVVSEAALGQRVKIRVGDSKLVAKVGKDGLKFEGTLGIPAGQQKLFVKLLDAQRTGPPLIDVFGLTLVPAEK